ncbi:hypothetical protein [Limosilactobacillus reuteri]|uniref:hypothetical protein n=1 Tax=Limosilactobacillus reuteri TaxID=1598 RepID=UPI0013E8F945|nr:hypothetical protein [Limosilactobacillus reuteri]UXE88506.1 hypothetical protein N4560_07290 [Limosilactobacillus reuteri]
MNEVRNLGDFEPTSFDYSQLDDETSVFLKQRVRNMESIADDTRYRMGKELFQAQERLADHYKGTFVKWFKSLGLDKDNVYFWINEFKFSRNLENTKQALNFGSASKSLKKDVMKKNAPNEAKQAVLNGDITTHKEYVALEKKLKQREQELSDKNAQIADQQAELEDNRKTQLELNNRLAEANKQQSEPKVITKTVTKEVPVKPNDYEEIKAKIAELKEQSAKDKENIEYYKRELKAAERINKNANSYDKLQEQELKRKKRQAEINGYNASLKINDWIPELQKLSQEDVDEMGEQAQKNLQKRLELLQRSIDRLSSMLGGRRIIEGEYQS